jgi:serine/threonine protein kinase
MRIESARTPQPPKLLSVEEFVQNLGDSGLLPQEEIGKAIEAAGGMTGVADGSALGERLIAAKVLTAYQAAAVRDRKFHELVIGNYEVLERLGAGGMGTVYKARHRRMKRVVALKLLSPSVAQSGMFVQRFQREVEVIARLGHPHIIMAFDADEAEAGHFLVMEFVNGRDLATEVQQRGPLPVNEAVGCIVQAAGAMEYAHGQGIIHRDIKPANLLRDVSGVVKVADLGLARFNTTLGRSAGEISGVTQSGVVMGTADYMPPEQAVDMKSLDHRADIYSLGCTLFYLLTGRPPYEGDSFLAVLLKHRDAPVPSLSAARPEVGPALDAVFRRMVAKNAEDRYPSMAEVWRALEAALAAKSEATKDRLKSTEVLSPPPLSAPPTPAAPQQAPRVAAAAGPTAEFPVRQGPHTGDLTVLLVEPSRAQSVIIRKFLQDLGVKDVPTTGSGQKALELARGSRPQVVVSAMHLADMTGVQLAQTLRSDAALSSTGFVLISSQADEQEASLLREVPHTALLPKPFQLDQLKQALAAVTGNPMVLAPATQPVPLDRLKVLIVDDSPPARRHIRSVLTNLGFRQFVEAADGTEAVTLLEKDGFDLVVTDYNMPRLNGRGLIQFIRKNSTSAAIPVIMVTTETDPAKLEAVRQLGVSAICDKSFEPETIRKALGTLLPDR